jgi:hypothetical protein
MKFSQAISWVKGLNSGKTNISKTISVLVLRVLMVFETLVFFTIQPLNLADSPRELHYKVHLTYYVLLYQIHKVLMKHTFHMTSYKIICMFRFRFLFHFHPIILTVLTP